MDLKSLKAALKPLTKFGQEEHVFDVEGIEVHLKPLLPREEIECQRKATELLKEAQDTEGLEDNEAISRTLALYYFDQFRIEVISYAIVQIGEANFRDLSHIETGEVLENGTKVKIPLQKAIREVIEEGWSRGMITITFVKYGDLIAKISERADRVARDSIADLDSEIERVESRLKNLKVEREGRAKGDPSITSQQISSLIRAGNAMEEEINREIETAREDRAAAAAIKRAAEEPNPEEEIPIPVPSSPRGRVPVTPDRAPPPTAPPPPIQQDSIEELEGIEAATLAESQIRMARAGASKGAREDLGADMSRAIPVGTIEGREAFKLPAETISPRGKGQAPKKEVQPDTTRNPNFKPSGR